MDITSSKMSKILVARPELLSLFIAMMAIGIALCLYMILSILPSEEVARIILAVAVGYIAANRIAAVPAAKDMKDTSEEENNNVLEVEVTNENIVPAMIAFSDESRPALINSSTLSSGESIDHHIDDSDRVSLIRQRRQSCVDEDEDDHAIPFRIQMESMWHKRQRRMSSLSCTDTNEQEKTEVMICQDQVSVSQETVTDRTVTTNRSSKEKQDDIKLMLGLHSCSSEESKFTRRNSYYALARTPKLPYFRNRRKSA